MLLGILTIILAIITFSFVYTTYRFIRVRKKALSELELGIIEYFKKYNIPNEGNKYLESLNMDALDSDFGHKALLSWTDANNIYFVNSDFDNDIGVLSLPLSSICDLRLVSYQNSEKKDLYLDFKSDTETKTVYFKEESFDSLKSLLPK